MPKGVLPRKLEQTEMLLTLELCAACETTAEIVKWCLCQGHRVKCYYTMGQIKICIYS